MSEHLAPFINCLPFRLQVVLMQCSKRDIWGVKIVPLNWHFWQGVILRKRSDFFLLDWQSAGGSMKWKLCRWARQKRWQKFTIGGREASEENVLFLMLSLFKETPRTFFEISFLPLTRCNSMLINTIKSEVWTKS